jgi:hypothetical protein
MINLDDFKHKIKTLVNNQPLPPIAQIDNVYHVFDRYKIVQGEFDFALYLHDDLVAKVAHGKTAISWCLAHNARDWYLASELIKLDHTVQAREFDILLHKTLAKKTQDDKHELHRTLFYEHINRLREAKAKLNKCVSLAKYNKIKDFYNESN